MHDRTRRPPARNDVDVTRDTGAWFRQPVVWLGATILVVSLGACIATIVIASRHADAPVEAGGGRVMGVPLGDGVTASPPVSEAR
jgi:hypothetical protein